MSEYSIAVELVKDEINKLRNQVPQKYFNKNRPAEVEINKFYFNGDSVDRLTLGGKIVVVNNI